MSSKRSTSSSKEPEKRTDKPDRDAQERAVREREERERKEQQERDEVVSPATGRTFETDREGVHSATEGGIPDPSVQPGGGTVTDPIPGAPKPA